MKKRVPKSRETIPLRSYNFIEAFLMKKCSLHSLTLKYPSNLRKLLYIENLTSLKGIVSRDISLYRFEGCNDPYEEGILELLPSGGLTERGVPTLTLHGKMES
jgi:hypothetical protein